MANLDQHIAYLDARDIPQQTTLRTLLTLVGEDMAIWRQANGFAQDFRGVSYESILDRMLSRIPNDIDKRQGSIVYDALAPMANELANLSFERQSAIALTYASKSVGKWLDLRVAEHGILRIAANTFVGKAVCWADEEHTIPYTERNGLMEGSWLQIPDAFFPNGEVISFVVEKEMDEGVFLIRAVQSGAAPNAYAEGTRLFPERYVVGVRSITLNGIETPGRDEESDEELFERFVDYISNPPFGGNRADYRDVLRQIDGMGGFKLYRADKEKGYVRVVVVGKDGKPPSPAFIAQVQQTIDPEGGDGTSAGEGLGEAPMCHYVTIEGATAFPVDIDMHLQLNVGVSIGQVRADVEAVLEAYFLELVEQWDSLIAKGEYRYIDTIVRGALIDANVLNGVDGISDIQSTLLNGQPNNLVMAPDDIPQLGMVRLQAI